MSNNPFEKYSPKATDDKLELVRKKAEEADELERHKIDLELELSQINVRLQSVIEKELPELMSEIGMNTFSLANGSSVKIKEFVRGSLPKDESAKQVALSLLTDYEASDLIKTNVKAEFSKSGHNEALDLAAKLEKDGYAVTTESGVHPQTLQAFARERMRNGDEIDLEKLGLYAGKRAEIKVGK